MLEGTVVTEDLCDGEPTKQDEKAVEVVSAQWRVWSGDARGPECCPDVCCPDAVAKVAFRQCQGCPECVNLYESVIGPWTPRSGPFFDAHRGLVQLAEGCEVGFWGEI